MHNMKLKICFIKQIFSFLVLFLFYFIKAKDRIYRGLKLE